jgi:hypothetical protein
MLKRLIASFVLLLSIGASAQAGQIAVAILGSPNGGLAWNQDVQSKLLGTGFFSRVDIYDISQTTPSLSTLETYQAVLVYSDSNGYQDSTQLGDTLADYVDAGFGVVVAVFADASIPFSGRFATQDYWAIDPAAQDAGPELTLGTYDASSPLMAGVTNFDGGGSSYRSSGPIDPLATLVASWSDGSPLVASRFINSVPRVDLNFYPPSNAVRSDFWLQTTDGALLLGNALVYTGSAGGLVLPSALVFPTQLVQTYSKGQQVTLTNAQNVTLNITSIAPSPNYGETNTCGNSLAPRATCTITVTFGPNHIGTIAGTVTVTDDAPNSPQTITLSGVGTFVGLNPGNLTFGSVPVGTTSSARTITLINRGQGTLAVAKVSLTGTDPGDFAEANTCLSGVAAGSSCTISVTFSPKATGSRTATLNISDNGGGSPQAVSLSGTGT